MEDRLEWPGGYFERLHVLSEDLPDDFKRPNPLPQSPDRVPMTEESPARIARDGSERGPQSTRMAE
jgi:hypothetical protein